MLLGRQRSKALRALVFAACVAASPAAAAGGEAGIRFQWDAPEGCPSSANVEARITGRVGRSQEPRLVRAEVTRGADHVVVHVRDEGAEREIVAPTCEAAAEAVAVVVALAAVQRAEKLAVQAQLEVPPPAAAADPRTEAPSGNRDSAAQVRRAGKGEGRENRRFFGTFLGFATDSASLPSSSFGPTMDLEIRRGALAGRVSAAAFFPQADRRSGDPPVRTSVWLLDVTLMGCGFVPIAPAARVEVGACVGAGGGLLGGSSAGVSNPDSGLGVRAHGLALGELRVGLSRTLAVRVDAGALVDPDRASFRVRGVGDVHRPAAVAFRGSAGLELSFR